MWSPNIGSLNFRSRACGRIGSGTHINTSVQSYLSCEIRTLSGVADQRDMEVTSSKGINEKGYENKLKSIKEVSNLSKNKKIIESIEMKSRNLNFPS